MKKVVLVTGASSGIGEATAQALAQAGHTVFAGVRSLDRQGSQQRTQTVQLDVTDDKSVRAAIAGILDEAGRIDVIVNNAGVSLVGAVEATSDEEARALFDTNLFGVLRVSRAALPAMRQQGSGLIVNISSVLGFLPAPFMGLYAASKHAVEGLSESLDHEVRDMGVRVVLIQPSFTNTKLDTNARQTAMQIAEYAANQARTIKAVTGQIAAAPSPTAVAATILATVEGNYRMRRSADARARLLNVLRRFAPASQVDRSLRRAFGL